MPDRSIVGVRPLAFSGPGREHGFIQRGVALDQHRQPDLVQDGHDPGAGLADPQAAAGTVEAEVVGQQDADRLAREMGDVFEVDHDATRHRPGRAGNAGASRSSSMVASLSSSPTSGVTTSTSWMISVLMLSFGLAVGRSVTTTWR